MMSPFMGCLLICVIVFFGLPKPSAVAADGYKDTVTIVEGQTTLLPYPGVSRVSIGHPDIANAQATGPDEILLTGLEAGVTDLRIWTAAGTQTRFLLRVVDNSWVQILEIANIVLADVEGVNAREENGIVFIEGRILRQQDVFIVDNMKQKLSADIGKGRVVFNVVKPAVSLQAMIMLDVQVVEVRRSYLKQLGVKWFGGATGPTLDVTGFGDYAFEWASQFASDINVLESQGIARVLAEPKLVTRSGSQAEFLAGGEIPIPVSSDGDLSVTFKQVGVILKMQPVADPDGFIATKVEVEVSAVDDSVLVQGIPGFTVRKTKMEMNVLSGQTMAISGMLKADDSKAVDRFPGLASIPIIGELFKSRKFVDNVTELVIFVTPRLIDPEGKLNGDLLLYGKDLSSSARVETTRWSIYD